MVRRRILISAYACSPYEGSEHSVGWNLVTRLAKYHDITVLCGDLSGHLQLRHDHARYFAKNPPISGLSIHYVPPSPMVTAIERIHSGPGLWACYHAAYNLWQRKACCEARRLHQELPFDLTHQLNMTGYREPGYLWKLPIPFVWGPISGAADEPLTFLPLFSIRGKFGVTARKIVNSLQKISSRRPRKAAQRAAMLWTATSADYHMVTDTWRIPAEAMVETGTNPSPAAGVRLRSADEPLRLIWSGSHEPRKALPIVLHALTGLPCRDHIRLAVLGQGVENSAWRVLAERLGLGGLVEWPGRLPHDQALTQMAAAHACVFPSIREGTPHVVLEALSLGLPVICHDACGMGAAVTEECGIKVSLQDPQTSIAGFRAAIGRLLEAPSLLTRLSEGAIRRSHELSWDRKAEAIARAYDEVAESRMPGVSSARACRCRGRAPSR